MLKLTRISSCSGLISMYGYLFGSLNTAKYISFRDNRTIIINIVREMNPPELVCCLSIS